MLLNISRNEDRPELESKILAAAFKQSVERGDIDGSRLAHRELVGLLARKSRSGQSSELEDQVDRVFASDNLQVMDLATLVKARAAQLASSVMSPPISGGDSQSKTGGNGQGVLEPTDEDEAEEDIASAEAESEDGENFETEQELRLEQNVDPGLALESFDAGIKAEITHEPERGPQFENDSSEEGVLSELTPQAGENPQSEYKPIHVQADVTNETEGISPAESAGAHETEIRAENLESVPEVAEIDAEPVSDNSSTQERKGQGSTEISSETSESAGNDAAEADAEAGKKTPPQSQGKSGGRIRGRAARKKHTAEIRAAQSTQRKKQEPADAETQSESEEEVIDQAAILRAAWQQTGVLLEEETKAPETEERKQEQDTVEDSSSAIEELPEQITPQEPLAEKSIEESVAKAAEEALPESVSAENIPEDEVIASFEQTVAAGATPANYLDFGPDEDVEQSEETSTEEASFAPPEIYATIDFGGDDQEEAVAETDKDELAEPAHTRLLPDPDGASYYSWIGAEITDPFFVLHLCYVKAVRSLLIRQYSEDKTTALNTHDFKRQLRNMGVAYNVLCDPRTRLDYDLRQMGLRQPETGTGLTIPEDAKLPVGGGKVKFAFSELLIICRFFNPEQMLAIVNAARMLSEPQFWQYLAESGLLSLVELQSIQTAYQLICNGLISICQFEQAFQYVRMNQQQLLEILLSAGWLSIEELQEFADSPGHDALPEAPRFFEAHVQTAVAPNKDIQVGAVLPDWMQWDNPEEDESEADDSSSKEQIEVRDSMVQEPPSSEFSLPTEPPPPSEPFAEFNDPHASEFSSTEEFTVSADLASSFESPHVVPSMESFEVSFDPAQAEESLPQKEQSEEAALEHSRHEQHEALKEEIDFESAIEDPSLEDLAIEELTPQEQALDEEEPLQEEPQGLDFGTLAQIAEDRLKLGTDDEISNEITTALGQALSAAQAQASADDDGMYEVPLSLSAALTAAQELLTAADVSKEVHESVQGSEDIKDED